MTEVLLGVERHHQPARAFDHDRALNAVDDMSEFGGACERRVLGDRRRPRIGRLAEAREFHVSTPGERAGVAGVAFLARTEPGLHQLHDGRLMSGFAQRACESGGDSGLAYVGVGASYEVPMHRGTSLRSASISSTRRSERRLTRKRDVSAGTVGGRTAGA